MTGSEGHQKIETERDVARVDSAAEYGRMDQCWPAGKGLRSESRVWCSRRETKSDARSDRDPEILAAAGITIIRGDPHAP